MSLDKLYFGKDDAERDFTNNGLLKAGFLKTSMYNAAKNGSKSLVVGRKGSGKSAICLMLHDNFVCENKTYSCIVTPDAISAEEIRRFELLGINEEQAKKLVWRYIFLVQIAKFIIEVSKKDNNKENDIEKIRDFLIANGEINELSIQEKFWKIINRIKATVTLSAFGQEVEIEANKAPSEGTKLESKMEYLETYLLKYISNSSEYKLYILVDKVDEIWNNDSWSDLMVISLLMAAKEINEKFSNTSCLVFLRKDIYDILKFHDRDKFRGDEVHLAWNDNDLKQLILLRANASLNTSYTQDEFWRNYFVEFFDGNHISKYLLDRTLKRPRDFIQFCNLCKDNAVLKGNSTITEKDISEALDIYSNWKLNDLIAEWKINFPFLNDLFIIFSNSSYLIQRSRFKTLFEKMKPSLMTRYSDFANYFQEDSILNILYSIGFIGIQRNGSTRYYYEDPQTVETSDKIIIVHPAFRNTLRCTSSINMKPFEGLADEERLLGETFRGRSASRFLFENVRSSSKGNERLINSLQKINKAIRSERLPEDIENEVIKSLDSMISDFRENLYMGNELQFEMSKRSAIKYFDDLRIRFRESEFLGQKSNIEFALEDLIYDLSGGGFYDSPNFR